MEQYKKFKIPEAVNAKADKPAAAPRYVHTAEAMAPEHRA